MYKNSLYFILWVLSLIVDLWLRADSWGVLSFGCIHYFFFFLDKDELNWLPLDLLPLNIAFCVRFSFPASWYNNFVSFSHKNY